MVDGDRIKHEMELATYIGPDMIISADEMREHLGKDKRNTFSFPTGIVGLDELVKNVESGELIALGGPTKHGKTLLAQTLTVNFQRVGIPCLWFTFEVPERQFLAQIDPKAVFYLPKALKSYDMKWVEDRIIEGKMKKDTRIVFIDNLHHLVDMLNMKNISLDMGNIIRRLKRLAISENVVIFVLCHSRKPNDDGATPREVSEWDLRDSSFIPQESDSTWMIQRKMDRETKRFLTSCFVKICNHRRTGAMAEKVHLIRMGNVLVEDDAYYADKLKKDSVTSSR